MDKVKRRYDIDWLRTLGVLLVIPFHSLIIFNLNPWAVVYIKDTTNVNLFIILGNIIHRFHMPLLFMLAGMSVYFSLQSRTKNHFIVERIKKLLVPAIFGCIALNPIMTYIYLISTNQNGTFVAHLVNFFIKNPGDLSGINGGFTPAHLWFIIYLFAFSLFGLPLFVQIKKYSSRNFLLKIAGFFEKPFMLILIVIPVTLLSAIDILDDKNPFVYFATFFIGYFLLTNEKYQEAINRDKWVYLVLSIILIFIHFNIPTDFTPWSCKWILYGFFDSTTRIVPVFALIGIGNRFMNKNSRVLEYLSKASFPVYIIHMLINTIVGFFVIKLGLGVGFKYTLIVAITFTTSFALYEIIRRNKILGFLFAVKPFNRKSEVINFSKAL